MAVLIDWPDSLIPNEMTWALESNAKQFTSPFTGDEQVVQFPGSRWRASLTFTALQGDRRRQAEVLCAQLDGMAGKVRLWDFGARLVSRPPVALGSPIVSIADQVGSRLTTSGWTPDVQVLAMGDWIEVNGELKRVTADVVSTSTGVATLPIAPMLRSSPPTGTPLEVVRPRGTFRLADNSQGKFSRRPGNALDVSGRVTLEFVETWSS